MSRRLAGLVAGLVVWIVTVTAALARATDPDFPCTHCTHDHGED